MIIKVRDSYVKHYPPFLKKTKDITYLYGEIEDGDIVLYTNRHFTENHDNVKMKIALLMETREQELEYYNYIENNHNKFDLVFTNDKYLLELGIKNIKPVNCLAPTWLNDNYIKLYSKTKLCSMISSSKNTLSGHKFRLEAMNYINDNFKNIDLYGNNFKDLPSSKSHNTQCLSNGKIIGLKDYMFSVVIENSYYDYNFTEKIIDCFLSGTIPIYYGCPSISKFFNIKGILVFNNLNQLKEIIENLSNELYNKMYEYIKDNYNIAHNYKSFNLNDNEILNYYNYKFYYQEINEWFSSKGDFTYSLNHDLNENSIVIDVGAYKGIWAEKIYNKFNCNIFLIEPIKEFYDILNQKFNNIDKISYKNIGLSNKNSIINIDKNSINNDATKLVNSNSQNCYSVELMTLDRFLLMYNLKTIDLIQINIEGAEYDLLKNWLELDIVNSINTLQIQFHNFEEIENHITKREIIRNKLKNKGFKLKYCFNWVWECYTKLEKKKNIYIIGDSHTAAFTVEKHQMTDMNKIYIKNNFLSYRTFPYTCFNIEDKFEIVKNILVNLNINKNSDLFISYGESDIRHHIGFHSTDSNLEENIEKIVSTYINFLNRIKKIHNNLGVYAPIASGPYDGLSGTGHKSYKNSFERNKITKLFNNELRKQCYDNNIIFKTLFDKLIDKEENTINDYFDKCGIHLNPDKVKYLLEELFIK